MAGVILTGFRPFGGESVNPSWEAASRLDGRTIAGRMVTALALPCIYAEAGAALERALLDMRPVLVLATGQAGGRASVGVERLAVNLDDAAAADEAGARHADRPVVAGAPAAYFASVPVKRMVARLGEAGIPAHLSMSAGSFVCNHVFYRAAHLAATRLQGMKVGFLHLPFLPEQAARAGGAQPSMALETQMRALAAALEAALEEGADIAVAWGGTH